MQSEEVEFEFTPSILETSSLLTPNIVLNAPPTKLTFNPTTYATISTNDKNNSTSNSSSTTTATTTTMSDDAPLDISSADVKLSKIADELKQSINESRRPTPSPFQKMSSPSVFNLDRPHNVVTAEDGTTIEIPSTADVVKELEALTNSNPLQLLTKGSFNDNNEREPTINGDHIRYDSPPTVNMGLNVSPKKKLLIRSQSHTEPTSPVAVNNNNNNNNLSHSQKFNNDNNNISNTQNDFDDESSMDDSEEFTRLQDLPVMTQSLDANENNNRPFKATVDKGNDQYSNLQMRTDQNGTQHTRAKQQTIVFNTGNNKRTFQQANIGNHLSPMTKANTTIIPQAALNEVSSTDQSASVKRQRTAPAPVNNNLITFRSSNPPVAATATAVATDTSPNHGSNGSGGSEDTRKKQIRDSNREAARRCRERRRQYIEQLEGNLEQYKAQIKQLGDKLARIERENTQLRAILSETKILHPTSRLSVNESHVDYANIVAAAGIDLNSDSNLQADEGILRRNYNNRNNL